MTDERDESLGVVSPPETPSPTLETETLGVARGGGFNAVGALFNQAARLLITLILGRLLGTESVGIYYLAVAFHDLVLLFCAGWFQSTLTHFVASQRAKGDDAAIRRIVTVGLTVSTLLALVLAAIMALVADPLARTVFGERELALPLVLAAAALPFSVFGDVALAATRGFKTMRPYVLIKLIYEPGGRLVITCIAIALGAGVVAAVGALLAVNATAAVAAWWALRRRLPAERSPGDIPMKRMFSFSFLAWGSALAIDAFIWADTLLIGALRNAEDVGLYQVATRVVLLSAIFVFPLGAAFGPRISDLYSRGESELLGRVYQAVAGWVLRLSLPFFVALVVFPEEILSVFGQDFEEAALVTVLLAFGALFNSATGPANLMLTMSGRPGVLLANAAATLALNIGLNVWLIPEHGIYGAAVAWTISLFFMNAVVAGLVWFTLRAHPFGPGFWKGLLAAAIALAATAGVDRALDGLLGLVVGVVVLVVTLGVASVTLGLTEEDRLVLGRVVGFLRRSPGRPSEPDL